MQKSQLQESFFNIITGYTFFQSPFLLFVTVINDGFVTLRFAPVWFVAGLLFEKAHRFFGNYQIRILVSPKDTQSLGFIFLYTEIMEIESFNRCLH
jgi:hypothetical protein